MSTSTTRTARWTRTWTAYTRSRDGCGWRLDVRETSIGGPRTWLWSAARTSYPGSLSFDLLDGRIEGAARTSRRARTDALAAIELVRGPQQVELRAGEALEHTGPAPGVLGHGERRSLRGEVPR